MRRSRLQAWGAAVLLLAGGCATGPLRENPVLVQPAPVAGVANPVYLPYGPKFYGTVFEHVLDVVDDYFEVAYSNRYDGRIETFPRIAPGVGQPWKPGSPDFYQRVLASFQTIRHRAIVVIMPTHEGGGGYKVDVKVYKELEDLERPIRATYGSAIFRADNQIERQYEVVDPAVFESTWIPVGRDEKLEQVLLERIAHMNPPAAPQTWSGWWRQVCTGLVKSPAPPPPAPLPPQTPPPQALPPATLPPGNP